MGLFYYCTESTHKTINNKAPYTRRSLCTGNKWCHLQHHRNRQVITADLPLS